MSTIFPSVVVNLKVACPSQVICTPFICMSCPAMCLSSFEKYKWFYRFTTTCIIHKESSLYLPIREKQFLVAMLPVLPQSWSCEIPVRTNLARNFSQVLPKLFRRGSTPEPVPIIDFVNHQARLEYYRMRDHGIVVRV